MSVLFVYETYQENSSSAVVHNTNLIKQSLERIFSLEKAQEAAFLKYLLKQDSAFASFDNHSDSIRQHFDLIDSLIQENQVQKAHLAKLRTLFENNDSGQKKIIDYLGKVEANKKGSLIEELNVLSSGIRNIRIHIDTMQRHAAALSKEHELNVQKHTIIATMMGVTASIFSMIIFILAFYFIDQELKRSRNYLNETQNLNKKIAEINNELENANASLLQLNSELEGKNVQLEKYAAELSSFTHITSHDMQEPLRKIEFYISLVEDREGKNLSEDGIKFLEKTKQSVSRMRQLFLSMLDFSLTNTAENERESVDLNEVLAQTMQGLKVYIKDTNAIIETSQLPTVKGVRYQLVQLFENILSNAIKFRRPDTILQIQVKHETFNSNGMNIRGLKNNTLYHKIDFEDNGIGFDPQHSERIFEIFQRLIVKTDRYGVGIGLAISRKIAQNHGGMLIAKSQQNVGSVFSLYIPVS